MKKIEIESLSELPKVAEAVLGELRGRSVVLFRGPMGAGKTTLISRIAAALGAEDTVTSPTFALVNQYEGEGGRRIYHFDFYRINNVEEALDLGYDTRSTSIRESSVWSSGPRRSSRCFRRMP